MSLVSTSTEPRSRPPLGTQGTAPLNYLQIYYEDIQYAQTNVNAPAQVVEAGGTVSTTAQDLLNLASQKLATIAEPPLLPAINPGGVVPGTIQPGAWVSIYGANLGGNATWTRQLSGVARRRQRDHRRQIRVSIFHKLWANQLAGA
jgi:hypothetical protein